jgi:hypothetical protein
MHTRQLDVGKIATFLLVTVVLSLTQVWALALILWGTGKPVDIKTLLGWPTRAVHYEKARLT